MIFFTVHDSPWDAIPLQVAESRATSQKEEEGEEDEFIRKLREELNLLNEIEEVVENVLGCIKLGLPIRVRNILVQH